MQSLSSEYLDSVYIHFDITFANNDSIYEELCFLDKFISVKPSNVYEVACNLVIISDLITDIMLGGILRNIDKRIYKDIIKMCIKASEYINVAFKYSPRDVSVWITKNIFLRSYNLLLEYNIVNDNNLRDILHTLIIMCGCGSLGYPEDLFLSKVDKFMRYSFIQARKHGNEEIVKISSRLESLYHIGMIEEVLDRYFDFKSFALLEFPTIDWSVFLDEFRDLDEKGLSRSDTDSDFFD